MNSKVERFFTFIMKEKTRNIFAFTVYISFIIMFAVSNLPLALEIICVSTLMIISLFACTVYLLEWMDKMSEKNSGKLRKNIAQETKKIGKEIVMFIPIWLISICVTSFIMIEQPANQTKLVESFYESPISELIYMIIIAPIIEEFIFRFLPYRFIKNKTLYVIVSTVIFATMHVINDPNAFYYVWFYMIRPLYYGYRYYETKDILVTISLHSLNNFISTLPLIISYF